MATLINLHRAKIQGLINQRNELRIRLARRERELAKAIKAGHAKGLDMEIIASDMEMTRTGVYNYMDRHIPMNEGGQLRKGKSIEGGRRDIESG